MSQLTTGREDYYKLNSSPKYLLISPMDYEHIIILMDKESDQM